MLSKKILLRGMCQAKLDGVWRTPATKQATLQKLHKLHSNLEIQFINTASLTPHSSLLTPHSSLLTPHSSLTIKHF